MDRLEKDCLGRRSLPDLCRRLREARRSGRLTQSELARRAGISWRTVARIEAGTVPSAVTLRRLERALGAIVLTLPDADRARTRGGALREMRLRCGRSIREVAWGSGISYWTLRRAEGDLHVPRGGWDNFFEDVMLAQALCYPDERAMLADMERWMDGG